MKKEKEQLHMVRSGRRGVVTDFTITGPEGNQLTVTVSGRMGYLGQSDVPIRELERKALEGIEALLNQIVADELKRESNG